MSAFFKYAAAAAASAIILLAIVLAPRDSWDAAMVVSALLLALSVALPLVVPSVFTGHGKSETGSLATIGISGIVLTAYFILSLGSFVLAASGIARSVVWAAIIVSAGCLIIGSLIARGSIEYLDKAFPDGANTIKATRSGMMAELSIIRTTCPTQFAGDIDRVLEKLQFSANDLSNASSNENEEIIALLKGNLKTSCQNNDPAMFRQCVSELEERISAREISLKAARSKV